MPGPWQYALTVGPMGFYLWVLALWQSDQHPRVVRGLVDFALLAFAVGGVLAFGPFGQLVAQMVFGRQDPVARLAVASLIGLWGCYLARRSMSRLVVYRVEA